MCIYIYIYTVYERYFGVGSSCLGGPVGSYANSAALNMAGRLQYVPWIQRQQRARCDLNSQGLKGHMTGVLQELLRAVLMKTYIS